MIRTALVLALLTGSTETVAAETRYQTVVEFTKWPGRGQPETVAIEMSEHLPGRLPLYRASKGGAVADQARCPALQSVVDSASAIPVPALKPDPAVIVVADGPNYSLMIRTGNDTVTITTGWGPVAEWIDHSFAALKDCWSAR